MKAYKGFNVDKDNNLICRGYKFEVGKEHSINGDLKMCCNGFHFCWELNNIHDFYSLGNSVICEIDVLGDIINDIDMKKSCTNKIKITKILTKEEVLKISNNGMDNTGYMNTGNMNIGDRNTGNMNTGYMNTGDRNTGDWNTGNWNTGDRNTGNWNTGNWNTGDWNTSNYNDGFFNTKESKVSIFDSLSEYTNQEFRASKYYRALVQHYPVLTEWIYYTEEEKANDKAKKLIGGYLKKYDYKEAHKIWWDKLSDENKDIIKNMPNFNSDIFYAITGIKI